MEYKHINRHEYESQENQDNGISSGGRTAGHAERTGADVPTRRWNG